MVRHTTHTHIPRTLASIPSMIYHIRDHGSHRGPSLEILKLGRTVSPYEGRKNWEGGQREYLFKGGPYESLLSPIDPLSEARRDVPDGSPGRKGIDLFTDLFHRRGRNLLTFRRKYDIIYLHKGYNISIYKYILIINYIN